MKSGKTKTKSASLHPQLVYCCRSIIDLLQEMLKRPDIFENCEQWHHRQHQGVYMDVYGGKIWIKFLNPNGILSLSVPCSYAFQLNAHTNKALWRSHLPNYFKSSSQRRFLLLGVISDPKEPSPLMNSFMNPQVNELQQLWQDVMLTILVKAAWLWCNCDIPASGMMSGFVSHGAVKRYSKCLSAVW
jgi:hypothetical protein